MAIGLIGRKCGMTRVFLEDGISIPVTVIEFPINRVTQIKTDENDGYFSFQLTAGQIKPNRLSKASIGHFSKANVQPGYGLWEFRTQESDIKNFGLGEEIKVTIFKPGQLVDVRSISKGKGFSGVIKRHNFRTQDATHGNSLSHRAPGSIGQRQSPGRVFKGKRMAGQLGNKFCTVQSQKIINVDDEKNIMLIKGSVPGAKGSIVVVLPAKRHQTKNDARG